MGVERESEASALAALSCRRIQGFLLSPPLSADALTRWATSAPIADLLTDIDV